MNLKKFLKVSFIGTASIISIGAPVLVSYKMDEWNPSATPGPKLKTPKIIYKPKAKLTYLQLFNAIVKKEKNLLNFTIKEFMVFVKELKDETKAVNVLQFALQAQGYTDFLKKIKLVDIDVLRWFIDVFLNKGLATISRKDIPKLKQLATLFPEPKKEEKAKGIFNKKLLLELIEYIPIIFGEGLKQLIVENNNAFFEAKAPQLASLIVNKAFSQVSDKAKTQISQKLVALLKKLLITGYNLETSPETLANDLVDFIYLLSDTGAISEIPRVRNVDNQYITALPISIEYTLKQTILQFISFLRRPTIQVSNEIIEKKNKEIKAQQAKIDHYSSEINKLKIQNNQLRLSNSLTDAEFESILSEVRSAEKADRYSAMMHILGIDNDALADVNKFEDESTHHYKERGYVPSPNRLLKTKWYEDKQKGLWVLARALWNLYPNKNKNYQTKAAWYQKVERDWEYGITGFGWWTNGGPAANPDSERLKETIKKAYGAKALSDLEETWKRIEAANDNDEGFFAKNAGKKMAKLSFSRQKFWLATELMAIKLKIEKQIDQIENLQQKQQAHFANIKDLRAKIKEVQSVRSYQYEKKYKITEKALQANKFFKGTGLIKLSEADLSKLFYKVQDVLLNNAYYLDLFLGKIVRDVSTKALDDYANNKRFPWYQKAARKALAETAKLVIWLTDDIIKKEAMKFIMPQVNKVITDDLKAKVKFVDTIRVSKALFDVLNKGIAKTANASFVYLFFVAKRFVKQAEKISNQNLLKLLLVFKHGLRSLSLTSRITITNWILDQIPFDSKDDEEDKAKRDSIKELIKRT